LYLSFYAQDNFVLLLLVSPGWITLGRGRSSLSLVYAFLNTWNIISSINPVYKCEFLAETRLTTVIFSKLYRTVSCILITVFVHFGALELFDNSHARFVEMGS
jgi:hypothetical protein